jgi:uncharacterized protein (TIGR01244 family)
MRFTICPALTLLLGLACAARAPQAVSPIPATAEQIPNQLRPSPELIVGGQPTPDQLSQLAAEGLRLVIDLRGPDEDRGMDEQALVEELGIQYLATPIASREALNWETAQEVQDALESSEGTALVHCRSGNRVGAIFALGAGLDSEIGVDQALEIGRLHGLTSLEDHVRPLLEARPPVTKPQD